MPEGDLITLAALLVMLSVFSIGGGPKLMAPLAYEVVQVHRWMSGEALVALYGLSRILPGTGGLVLLAGLVGWTVGGAAGAVVAPLALVLPAALIAFVAAPRWLARPGAAWKGTLHRMIAPIAVGQGVAGGLALLFMLHAGWTGLAVTAAAFVAGLMRMPALAILAAGGATMALAVLF